VLWLHVKALSSFLDQAVTLVNEVLQSVDFSNYHHIEEIIQREYAWAEHSAQSDGYTLASTSAFAHLSRAGQYNEYIHGIQAHLHLRDLANHFPDREAQLHQALARIRDLLFRRPGLLLSITAGQDDIRRFQQLGAETVTSLPDRPSPPAHADFPAGERLQAFTTPAEIVYNVQACTLFPASNLYHGQFEVLRTWLSRDYLWNTVRQQNGAYGCFVQFNHLSGNFGMVSYRDPQVRKTYEAYEALASVIDHLDVSGELLDQLIIGAYSSYTPHLGPASKGASARNDFLSGISTTFRQERLHEILATTPADLKAFAPLFLRLKNNPCRTTLGNASKIEQDKELFARIIEL
jgi:Zn-dependent M16 (insulinase) family peptidase